MCFSFEEKADLSITKGKRCSITELPWKQGRTSRLKHAEFKQQNPQQPTRETITAGCHYFMTHTLFGTKRPKLYKMKVCVLLEACYMEKRLFHLMFQLIIKQRIHVMMFSESLRCLNLSLICIYVAKSKYNFHILTHKLLFLSQLVAFCVFTPVGYMTNTSGFTFNEKRWAFGSFCFMNILVAHPKTCKTSTGALFIPILLAHIRLWKESKVTLACCQMANVGGLPVQ